MCGSIMCLTVFTNVLCTVCSSSSHSKGEELSASAIAKKEEESKLAREKMREEQRRREAVSES